MLRLLIISCMTNLQHCTDINNVVTNDTLSSEPLVVQLLRIQNGLCGDVRWCTVNITSVKEEAICCKACSCDEKCGLDHSCCPDYEFGKYANWTIFDSISSFAEEFSDWSSLEGRQIGTSAQFEEKNEAQKCLRRQIQKSTKYQEDAGMYLMTTKCSANRVADDVIKERCESDSYNYALDVDHMPSYDDLTPVQSLEDGTIFRNMFCAACSGTEHDVSPWSATILSTFTLFPSVYYWYFQNPNTILQQMLKSARRQKSVSLWSSNIIFEPATCNAINASQTCTAYDFVNCPDNTTKEAEICERFFSPVQEYNGYYRDRVAYRNAACLDCQGATVNRQTCTNLHGRRRSKLWLNVPRGMASLSVSKHVDDALHVTFPGDPGRSCIAGEMYDKMSKLCRKMVCPRGMFAFQGQCHFFFTRIDGGDFVVLLSIHVATAAAEHNTTGLTAAIYTTFQLFDELEARISITDQSVWQDPVGNYILYVAFELDKSIGTFSDAINFVRNIVTNQHSLSLGHHDVAIDISIADQVQQSGASYMDLRNRDVYTAVYPEHWKRMKVEVMFEVSEGNFCYRIDLKQQEYNLARSIDKKVMQIKSTQTIVYDFTRHTEEGQSSALVCAHHVLSEIKGNTKLNLQRQKDVVKEPQDVSGFKTRDGSATVTIEKIIAPVLISSVLILCVVLCIVRHRYYQSSI